MATLPTEPDPPESGPEAGEPNTSRLPIEPEFAPDWAPAEPSEPGTDSQLP